MEISRLENVIREIAGSIDKGDVYAVISQETPIEFKANRLSSVEDHDRFSIGLRLFENGRIGNSYINSLDDADDLIAKARQSVLLGESLDFELPCPKVIPSLDLSRPETASITKEKMIDTGETIVREITAWDKRLQASVDLSVGRSTVMTANTSGLFHAYESTGYFVSMLAELVEDDESLLYLFEGEDDYGANIDINLLLKRLEWHYRASRNKASCDTGYMPVLFAPECAGTLLEPIEIAANGKTLFKGMSLFDGKTGEKVVSSKLTITDDPFYIRCSDCYPVDDEGVVPNALHIIDKGVFRNFIYDLATAKRMGCASTGHGSRSSASLPNPDFSNLVFAPGEASFEDMIRSVKNGIYVVNTLGAGQSNVIAGDLSFTVDLGYRIENGKITGRVKDVMVAGNVFDWLGSVLAVENKLRKMGGMDAPHLLIDKVSVSG